MTKYTGATIEAAIQNGLKSLDTNRNNVEIKVIKTASKGFLGFFKHPAEVEMNVKTSDPARKRTEGQLKVKKEASTAVASPVQTEDRHAKNVEAVSGLIQYLQAITDQMGIEAELSYEMPNNRHVTINFDTPKEGLLIGKHGRTINALQELSNIYLNNMGISYLEVELDTANYRQRRLQILTSLAERTAREVVATGKPVYLDPMPSFERKQIHVTLQDSSEVMTYSAGREPHRSIVVAPR
ncbi:RNA-binding cell elongation regulator Jag/EloR [Fructilactobacillus fructivorans]|uniref:RNA-binding cell elongation regulator Jag/EloR n=1 Tax=Fructilactobacillus fructivorans TaxID=1614 RepID=UPI000704EEDF|nr:RNA-binding cell elongation regulator Jag/EloR [Fructilactobacillus fructivorans]KRN41279.1 single-stranded nucleic acid binding R3H domain-containing protein [Fructilactobacillus fructivorans]KRN43094.1 single-stranded nucleic acid binding R3H domain-containing protein [Fructilactobacillus fructivorans]